MPRHIAILSSRSLGVCTHFSAFQVFFICAGPYSRRTRYQHGRGSYCRTCASRGAGSGSDFHKRAGSSDDIALTLQANSRMAVRWLVRSFVVPYRQSLLQRPPRPSIPRVEILARGGRRELRAAGPGHRGRACRRGPWALQAGAGPRGLASAKHAAAHCAQRRGTRPGGPAALQTRSQRDIGPARGSRGWAGSASVAPANCETS
jgi:hypothetical protein